MAADRRHDWTPRPRLPGGASFDVAIVGAGLTGLWAAYYLIRADPTLRIAVLEAEVAGFGASGRNGGWCSAKSRPSLDTLAKLPGSSPSAALAQAAALRATESYTSTLPGHHRDLVPIYSLVVATEPLTAAIWEVIGLAERETFSDHRHLIIYGQRTADDRLVFGGRGAPHHFGSRVAPAFDRVPAVFDRLAATLRTLFPVLGDVGIDHAWGGPLGVPRDWCASVGFDRRTGHGWAGGYVGHGVAAANLAGRTLRDLVRGEQTPLTKLSWVGHRSPRWEIEPLRWLGANAGLRAALLADVEERLTRQSSVVARLSAPLLGAH